MSGEQIQVCEGWWRQRCGDVVRVTRDTDSPVGIRRHYPWQCKSHNYTDSGRMDSGDEYGVDLVEFLGEEIEVRRVR